MRKICVLIMSMIVILSMAACTDVKNSPTDDMTKTGVEITDALSFIKNVTPEYIKDDHLSKTTEKDKDGNVVSSAKILADLLNAASNNIVDEPKKEDSQARIEWWMDIDINYSDEGEINETLDLKCNENESIVEIRHMKDDNRSTIFVNAPDLYEYVRYRTCYVPEVDEKEYAKYSDILDKTREITDEWYKDALGIKENELIKFIKIYEYNESDGKTVKIYDMETAISCEHPDLKYIAGGQYFDGKLRLRNGPTQFIVRLDGDRIVSHTKLACDMFFSEESLKDEEYKKIIMKEITRGLNRNEALSKKIN